MPSDGCCFSNIDLVPRLIGVSLVQADDQHFLLRTHYFPPHNKSSIQHTHCFQLYNLFKQYRYYYVCNSVNKKSEHRLRPYYKV